MFVELFKKSNPHNAYYYHFVKLETPATSHQIKVPGGNSLYNVLIVGNSTTPYTLSFEMYTHESGYIPLVVDYTYNGSGGVALLDMQVKSFTNLAEVNNTQSLRLTLTNGLLGSPFTASLYLLFKTDF